MADTNSTIQNLTNSIAEQKAELKRLKAIETANKKKRESVFKTFDKMTKILEDVEGLCWIWSKYKLNLYLIELNNDLDKIIKMIEGKINSKIKNFEADISISTRFAKNKLKLEDFTFFINFFTGANFSQTEVQNALEVIHPNLKKVECNICGDEKDGIDFVCFINDEKQRICQCKYDVCWDCGAKIVPQKCVLCRTPYQKLMFVR
jgi:hypothetical protein